MSKRKPTFKTSGMSGYSDEYYTPPEIVRALGEFDLDPCAARQGTARHARNNWRAGDGLSSAWFGRVWLNPPYSDVARWLARMAEHGNGIALVNAWTDRKWFQEAAASCSALFMTLGRLTFQRPEGIKSGHQICGSVFFAFGQGNADALLNLPMPGLLIPKAARLTPAP